MDAEVLFSEEGALGVITLNRPNALNALTLNMIMAIQAQLSLWKTNESIHAVVLKAKPAKAFCAGGDIRSLYYSKEDAQQMQFFWHEYRLNHFIHQFGKPYISLIDGMVMGGGVGISLHGSHPIASEQLIFAMPETSIGFFPDIGASHLLTSCPGSLGIYLGLTGNRLDAKAAMHAGLVCQIVPSAQMPALYDALMNKDLSANAFQAVDDCIQTFAVNKGQEKSGELNSLVDLCFAKDTIDQIRQALQQDDSAMALELDHTLMQKSPLSLKVTLAQLHKAKGLTLAQCLQMDYDLVGHFMQGKDFYEGVRALLIDKDKNPQWTPAQLDLISEPMVQDYFVTSEKLELELF